MRTRADLFAAIEDAARRLFRASPAANLDAASLLYILAGRTKTVAAMWQADGGAKEAARVAVFLKSLAECGADDGGEKAAVAEKTAFVLLAKQRPVLAAAFFVLAGKPAEAVRVCRQRLGDVHLGWTVARCCMDDMEGAVSILGDAATPVESLLVAAGGERPWAALLSTWNTDSPPSVAIKMIARLPLDEISIFGLWERGLYRPSLAFIAMLPPGALREQLAHEAGNLCESLY